MGSNVSLTYWEAGTPNATVAFDTGDIAFVISATSITVLMVPGLGLLYAGLVRKDAAVTSIWVCLIAALALASQWFLFGYSLAFSETASNGFIGDYRHFVFANIGLESPVSPRIPGLLYAFFQMEVCIVTGAIIAGVVAERGRPSPAALFLLCWATLVYCPMACWTWSVNGWARKWGVIDFAGGGPVEVNSGFTALAYSWVLGPRHHRHLSSSTLPVALGTSFLWLGWLDFNEGSALGASSQALITCWNTNAAAISCAALWVILEKYRRRVWSLTGCCFGLITGMIASTSSAGVTPIWSSLILGPVAALICHSVLRFMDGSGLDDTMGIFAMHGVGGCVGLVFNAIFASDDTSSSPGAPDDKVQSVLFGHRYRQLYVQLAGLLAFAINHIPGLQLRVAKDVEDLGIDQQLGEMPEASFLTNRWTIQPIETATESSTPRSEDTAVGVDDRPNAKCLDSIPPPNH
ncbi:hypothetical protein D0869_01433 [Hortaea werneckii]|uniref:Ammonium transporter AmtB-like domain-containing protein n=1 Tax=Hortaea werneckii TaxID=91943 RepID=A0A3M6XDA1_HORWE|nr:hypothetical protein D0869_01433 [Hortaea werneckii]